MMRYILALICAVTIFVTPSDAAKFANGNLIERLQSTAASAGTLTLVVGDEKFQRITGAAAHTVQLPDATTLRIGTTFVVINDTAANDVTVNNGAGAGIDTISPTQQGTYTLLTQAAAAGVWEENALGVLYNKDIAATAAVARSKIASGTADNVVINDGAGALSEEAQLAGTRGGSGISNAGTFTWGANNITLTTGGVTTLTVPTAGTLVARDTTDTLTNKTINGPDNTLTNIADGALTESYALLAGRAGGQSFAGGTVSGNDLTLRSNTSDDGDIILTDDVTLARTGQQDYQFSNRTSALTLQGQSSAVGTSLEVFSKDGDGTDSSQVKIWAIGTPTDVTDGEALVIDWSPSLSWYRIVAEKLGAGSYRPIEIKVDGFDGHIFLDTDAQVGINETDPDGMMHLDGRADEVTLVVDADAAQTAHIQDWRNSAEAVLASIDASGNLTTPGVTTDSITEKTGAAEITVNNELNLKNGAVTAGVLRIFEDSDDGAHKCTVTVPAMAGDITLQLPADDGSSGDFLITDGAGVTSWAGPGPATEAEYEVNAYAADQVLSSASIHQVVICSGAGTDITLYACGGTEEGYSVRIKRVDAVNDCTIKADATGTADEMDDSTADRVIVTNFDSLTMVCDGSDDWWII